ncbi:MAG: DUF3943 domain-containing protein, partial [Prevotella sp.]
AGCLNGLQTNLMTSFARTSMHGLQLSLLSNVANNTVGAQISAFGNVSLSPLNGAQISGVTNISRGIRKGLQLSLLSNISSNTMSGGQIGAYNYADTLSGAQVGLVNVSIKGHKGLQIGLINYSRDTLSHKIGLVSISPKTQTDILLYAGNSNKLNAAIRFRNRSTYSIFGFGTHYLGLDEDFSGSLYYRIGRYIRLNKRLSLSADAGYFHIETFRHNSEEKPDRLYSLQLRANADYRIGDYTSVFGSLGYGNTRYYNHHRHFRQKMIIETGLAFSYLHDKVSNTGRQTKSSTAPTDTSSIYIWDCPSVVKKRTWIAAAETFGINMLVNGFDRYICNEDFAKINIHSIRHNFKTGFVWDNDCFSTNLFAHPYHGGLYFNTARSNGLSFWESAPYSLGGSLMWELTCETDPPAINDLMATTLGGVCIGEITHRVSNLVYNDSECGIRRFLREAAGLIICPVKAFNRIVSGEAWLVRNRHYKYHDYNRIPVTFSISAGNRYLADEGAMFKGEHNPYLDLLLLYGDAFDNDGSKPYDYFTANITFGFSSNQPLINGAHLLGRLWGTNFYEGKEMTATFGIFQHFNYYDSEPVRDGSSKVPFRISEAAAFGPGLIYRFPSIGNLGRMEQRLFLDAILLGGSLTDHYNVIDRDYNLGSGFSMKMQTALEFPKFGIFSISADYYRIFTWKGYDEEKLSTADPLYLNAQGDKGNASLLVINPAMRIFLARSLSLDLYTAYYVRASQYKKHENVKSETYEVRVGLSYKI